MKRIGMFGGAFDPPHSAHLALAQLAVAALELDALHIIPTGQAWHKARTLSSREHRLAMTQLAFQGIPHVVVDNRELQRSGPTFTIDTLEALQLENPGAQLYLIMGADQFAAFKQWHKWQAIAGLAIICIADRAPSTPTSAENDAYFEACFEAHGGLENRFVRLQMPLMATSATQIRQLVTGNAGKTLAINTLVTEPVARYISANHLYSQP
jgi:nicotinate-nucleotide adenylyltransferase